MRTKVRKAQENLDTQVIVADYAEGTLSVNDIARKHNTTRENIQLIVNRHWKALTNMKESRALVSATTGLPSEKKALHALQNTDLINKEFQDLLSSDTANLLTEAEAQYAWIYTHTGDILEALKISQLDVGLYKEVKRTNRFSYDRACIIRSMYLNSKPNVAKYIQELREAKYTDTNLGKARIQSELIDQLQMMKAQGDSRNRKDILRCIELLGKTVGAFTERIEVTEVSPSNALDQLIEMAQEAEIVEIKEENVEECQ